MLKWFYINLWRCLKFVWLVLSKIWLLQEVIVFICFFLIYHLSCLNDLFIIFILVFDTRFSCAHFVWTYSCLCARSSHYLTEANLSLGLASNFPIMQWAIAGSFLFITFYFLNVCINDTNIIKSNSYRIIHVKEITNRIPCKI